MYPNCFPELIIPARLPQGKDGIFATRVDSEEDYEVKTGYEFDGEQAAWLAWKSALKAAGGNNGKFSQIRLLLPPLYKRRPLNLKEEEPNIVEAYKIGPIQ